MCAHAVQVADITSMKGLLQNDTFCSSPFVSPL